VAKNGRCIWTHVTKLTQSCIFLLIKLAILDGFCESNGLDVPCAFHCQIFITCSDVSIFVTYSPGFLRLHLGLRQHQIDGSGDDDPASDEFDTGP